MGTKGLPDNLSRFPIHSMQIGGTFGGATVTMEGSDDGVTYFTLTGENPAGGSDALVSATSANRWDVKNVIPQFIRPNVSGGDGTTAITVIVTSKSFGH
jgi:hypothetical protein